MTLRHLNHPALPGFDAPAIRQGTNVRITDLRRGCVRPADTGHRVEAR